MQETITGRLKNLAIAAPQTYRNITIFPLVDGDGSGGVDYLTLDEALEKKLLTVTEVSESGSVPELAVVNGADAMVLLLDGEELIGAKQNRVLNTSVLVAAGQSLTIPVSCTEQGRWRYVSPSFERSETVMARKVRVMKLLSVTESLQTEQSYRSDQAEIWSKLRRLEMSAGVESPTGAMLDVFESYGESLAEAMESFKPLPDQLGILAVIDGKAAGFDLVSRAPAYARLHGKLVKSYVMEALVSRKAGADHQPDDGDDAAEVDPASSAAASALLERAMRSEAQVFKSVGCGDDCRLEGDRITGSALVLDGTVVHAAFFQLDEPAENREGSSMSRPSRRRGFRM